MGERRYKSIWSLTSSTTADIYAHVERVVAAQVSEALAKAIVDLDIAFAE